MLELRERLEVERSNGADSGWPGLRSLPPRILLVLLAVSLPLVNPWVRGDGVGYYAFARALLIQRNLDFAPDYQHANQGFREARLDSAGNPKEEFRTATGHLENHFTVGPAMLWAPFLLGAHVAVLLARALGSDVPADGFSLPYLLAMAFGTVFYGFLALLLSYRVACRFVSGQWALAATIAVWWAGSLPVYMYFNPSWSHAHSAFAVALFFWYWLRTLDARSTGQWLLLALLAGLMLNVYYPNLLVLAVLIPEGLRAYLAARNSRAGRAETRRLLLQHASFSLLTMLALLPTFLTKYVLYGGIFRTGYTPVTRWDWRSPSFLAVLFSANHGLFSWTPILLFSAAGLFLFWRNFPVVGSSVLAAVAGFYYFMASYPDWPGISSYGNRFFISLTVFFVLGLATLLDAVAQKFASRALASASLRVVLFVLVVWNLGLIFQWGAHLIPARGPVSWSEVARNQWQVVPRQLAAELRGYLFRRHQALDEIEQRDIEQRKEQGLP